MHRCLQLAALGKGFVAPNPMVGAVIVHNGKIIGEGFHRAYGQAHAEVNAINAVASPDLLKASTLYVNLEPCSHYGKTPPCAELIIQKQIPRVVIGQKDPFSEVSGRGIKMLQESGVEVVVGVLESDCEALNKRFLTVQRLHRPYVILKWAESADGFLDRLRQPGDGNRAVRFSTDFTQLLVHKLRAEESAIMVGARTEILDSPSLNVRFWSGKNPIKLKPESNQSLISQLEKWSVQGIQSLIVEGGAQLLQSFIDENLWDEIRQEISPIILGKGVKSPLFLGKLASVQKCKNNSVLIHENKWNR